MYAIRLVLSGIYTAQQAKNIPNIILNSLVDTLNVKAKGPHTIVLMVNDHRFWNNTDLLLYQMERIIDRFFREIRRIIEARNLSLPPKVVNWDYPRLFITRALPLPNNMTRAYPPAFKANRRRYNRLIQRAEEALNFRSINLAEFTSENSNKLFAPDGSITHLGYKTLWISISDAIHKADNQDRIIVNKARAKQLASQITVTKAEIRNLQQDDDDDDDMDVKLLVSPTNNKTQEENTKRPIKRSLLNDFTSTNSSTIRSSPASVAGGEYFTQQPQQHRQNTNFYQNPHKGGHRFGGFRPNKKNNWRHNKW